MIHLNEHGGCELDDFYYSEDEIIGIFRIQKALFEEEKIIATMEECANIWQRHSASVCASWLFVPEEPKSIIDYIKSEPYFTSFENYAII